MTKHNGRFSLCAARFDDDDETDDMSGIEVNGPNMNATSAVFVVHPRS